MRVKLEDYSKSEKVNFDLIHKFIQNTDDYKNGTPESRQTIDEYFEQEKIKNGEKE